MGDVLTVIAYGSTHILKKRITYPRTGYVRLRSYRKKAWIAGIAGFVVAFGVWFAFRGAAYSILVLGTAVIWAFLYSLYNLLAHLEICLVEVDGDPGNDRRPRIASLPFRGPAGDGGCGVSVSDIGRYHIRAFTCVEPIPARGGGMSEPIKASQRWTGSFTKPGRLMIVALLSGVEQADFLYLQA